MLRQFRVCLLFAFFNKLGPNNKVKHLSFADIFSGNVIDGFKRRLANVPTL